MFSELDSSLSLLFISRISESEHEIAGYQIVGAGAVGRGFLFTRALKSFHLGYIANT